MRHAAAGCGVRAGFPRTVFLPRCHASGQTPEMLYLHKLLPLLLSPIVAAILLVLYGALRQRRQPALLAAVLLYLGSMPLASDQLLRLVEDGRVRQDPNALPKAEAIVVLGGMLTGVRSSTGVVSEWNDPDRFFGGIELYRLGKARKLIFTAGKMPWQAKVLPEGVVLKKAAEQMGIPAKDILVTEAVSNTEEEAGAVRQLLPGKHPSILLVTSAFHMARAIRIFERAGFDVREYAVDFKIGAREITPMDFVPSARALWLSDLAIREAIGRLYYRARQALGI